MSEVFVFVVLMGVWSVYLLRGMAYCVDCQEAGENRTWKSVLNLFFWPLLWLLEKRLV